ncbi:MAG: four helix bundle protein [Patescibacteria group bacterium]|jgi:four helix bundle protein
MIQTADRVKTLYDLENRTLDFARRINEYARALPRDVANIENAKQLVRAGGSVGANYIEANEALGKRDFAMRIRISKKEAKEARFWLLLTQPNDTDIALRNGLIDECTQLMKILGAILTKTIGG